MQWTQHTLLSMTTCGPAIVLPLIDYLILPLLASWFLHSQVLLPLLWQGKRQQALTHLHSLRLTSGEVPPPLEDAIRYLEPQHDWMDNYQRWQEQGYPVGSGLVERAVVINVRMKKRGMRWKRANATAVVAIRVQQINAEWE